jgi:hypothetical protein
MISTDFAPRLRLAAILFPNRFEYTEVRHAVTAIVKSERGASPEWRDLQVYRFLDWIEEQSLELPGTSWMPNMRPLSISRYRNFITFEPVKSGLLLNVVSPDAEVAFQLRSRFASEFEGKPFSLNLPYKAIVDKMTNYLANSGATSDLAFTGIRVATEFESLVLTLRKSLADLNEFDKLIRKRLSIEEDYRFEGISFTYGNVPLAMFRSGLATIETTNVEDGTVLEVSRFLATFSEVVGF